MGGRGRGREGERERGRERVWRVCERERGGGRERGREGESVCVEGGHPPDAFSEEVIHRGRGA